MSLKGNFSLGCVGLVFALSSGAAIGQNFNKIEPASLPDVVSYQKDFIARFTGAVPYQGDKTLKGRAKEKDRIIARQILSDEIESLGFEPVLRPYQFRLQTRQPGVRTKRTRRFEGVNIVFEIPANVQTSASKSIVLVAHYDAVENSPGADDNASGVAVILAVAAQIKQLKSRKHSVIIAFADQEELGLYGSLTFANDLETLKLDVHSVHAFDMLGWDGDGDRALELDPGSPQLLNLYERHAKAHNIPLDAISTDRSDHEALRQKGYVAGLLIEEFKGGDFNPHYHSRNDRAEYIDFEYLAANAAFVTSVLTELVTGVENVSALPEETSSP